MFVSIYQAIKKYYEIHMIDFKGGIEFWSYSKYGNIIDSLDEAVELFQSIEDEVVNRLNILKENNVKNINEYNKLNPDNKLKRIAIFVDEATELLDKTGAPKDIKTKIEKIEGNISKIARLGRAPGVSLFLSTQRASAEVLNGQIKNNIPLRICGRFPDHEASQIAIGSPRAAYLDNIKGRLLIKVGSDITEFQSYYFTDDMMDIIEEENKLIEKVEPIIIETKALHI